MKIKAPMSVTIRTEIFLAIRAPQITKDSKHINKKIMVRSKYFRIFELYNNIVLYDLSNNEFLRHLEKYLTSYQNWKKFASIQGIKIYTSKGKKFKNEPKGKRHKD